MSKRILNSQFSIPNSSRKPVSQWNARQRATLLVIVLCAFALRVYCLGIPSLHGDEAFAAQFADQSLGELIASLGRYEPHPPFYYVFLALWMRLAGAGEFALRFLSVWWGMLFVPWAYDLGKRLGSEKLGLVTAVLAAVNPFLIWHSQEARMYVVLATLAMASVALLVRAWLGERRLFWWAWAAVTWLALLTHYFAVFLAVAEVVALIILSLAWPGGRREGIAQLKAWAIPLSVAGLFYLPWAVYAAPAMLAHKKSWILPVELGEFFRRTLVVYGLGNTAAPWTVRWLWPGFLLIFIGGAVALARRQRRAAVLVGSCLLIPLAIVYLLSLRRPMFHERYLIFVLPPYLLFLASGVTAWAGWMRRRSRLMAMALAALPMAFLIGGAGLSLINHFYDPSYAKSPPWREMVQFLHLQSQSGDVVIQNYPDPALAYYLADRPPHVLVPAEVPFSRQEVEKALTDLVNSYPRLWLLPTRSADWDAEGLVETWFDRHGDLIGQQQFGVLRLRLYQSPMAFLETRTPLARLGQAVQLLGYRLSYEDDPIGPGDVLYLSLYWQADEPLATSYKVFTHLLDPTGWTRGQQDNSPVRGTYLTTEWQPGEVIVDRYEIVVSPDAPPGSYRLAVGMYDEATLDRLPVQKVACKGCVVPVRVSEDRIFLPVEITISEQ